MLDRIEPICLCGSECLHCSSHPIRSLFTLFSISQLCAFLFLTVCGSRCLRCSPSFLVSALRHHLHLAILCVSFPHGLYLSLSHTLYAFLSPPTMRANAMDIACFDQQLCEESRNPGSGSGLLQLSTRRPKHGAWPHVRAHVTRFQICVQCSLGGRMEWTRERDRKRCLPAFARLSSETK